MKLAFFQLKHYHFNHIKLEAIGNGEDSAPNESRSVYSEINAEKLKARIILGEPESSGDDLPPRYFFVTLGIEYQEPDFPYTFSVEIEGVFELHDTSKEDRHLRVVNGASVLYSSVRDQILTLSSRHKNGPIMLPSLDFRHIAPIEKAD